MTARSGTPSVDATLTLVAKLLGPKQAARVAEELGHEWRAVDGTSKPAPTVDIVEPTISIK
jgi:transcriptional regulator GlxA family with amidase domain